MRSPVSRFTVSGNSMFPTLKEGQDVLSRNWFINPKIGDVVVIKKSGKEMIKRITKISRSKIFVKGDNQKESTDSRDFGAIKMDNIVGKVIYTSVTLNEVKGIKTELYPSATPQDDNYIPCPNCSSLVIGVYGRKDAICSNCGFKLICCGE